MRQYRINSPLSIYLHGTLDTFWQLHLPPRASWFREPRSDPHRDSRAHRICGDRCNLHGPGEIHP